MSSDESVNDPPLQRVSSVNEKSLWDTVPGEIDFKLKIKRAGKKSVRFLYTLKKGLTLPYTPIIPDIQEPITFSKSLQPEVEGAMIKKDGEFWIIETTSILESPKSTRTISLVDKTKVDYLDMSLNQSTGLSIFSDTTLSIDDSDVGLGMEDEAGKSGVLGEDFHPDLDKVIVHVDDKGIEQFRCTFCSYVSELSENCKKHIIEDHKNWQADLKENAEALKQTCHTNPNWLADLTQNFKETVISKCSERVQNAVDTNEIIQNPRDWREVYDHILNTTIRHLEEVFGGVKTPTLRQVREIAHELAVIYPEMFRSKRPDARNQNALDGFRPKNKIPDLNGLAQIIIDRFRKRATKKRQFDNPDILPEDNPKKGRRAVVYGVDAKKAKGVKASSEVTSEISKTNSEEDKEARETVYEKYRMEIQFHFSNSANRISLICKGFLKHHMHLGNHFAWLGNTVPLYAVVKKNLIKQLGYLEKYLMYMNNTTAFKEEMEGVDMKCEMEFDGSKFFKYITLLRLGAKHLDSDGSCLIRLEEDGVAKINGPHIAAVLVNKSFVFEVHAEREKLLGNLDLFSAIASLLHLCFVVNLQYPKECQTMCDILQRKVAEYGDDSGTKTQKSKATATSKYEKYLNDLGRALSQ